LEAAETRMEAEIPALEQGDKIQKNGKSAGKPIVESFKKMALGLENKKSADLPDLMEVFEAAVGRLVC
jgi:hypothetical protein